MKNVSSSSSRMAENDIEPQTQTQTLDTDSRNTFVISRLMHSILSQIHPSPSPSLHSSFIQSRLLQLLNSFHTPTHPPYALMIRKAITELNADGTGSTEEAISDFIPREYQDLPWDHKNILDFHLMKLCQEDDLFFTDDARYVLPVHDKKGSQEKCRRGRKRKAHHGNEDGEGTETVENVELPQHCDQGNPEGNLDENPMPQRHKQKMPKGPRGRPRKTNTVANSQEETSFTEQGSIANNTVKQGQGRPRKVNNDTEQCGGQSQPEDQAKPSGRGRGRGRGRARGGGRGRGRGVNQDTEQ